MNIMTNSHWNCSFIHQIIIPRVLGMTIVVQVFYHFTNKSNFFFEYKQLNYFIHIIPLCVTSVFRK